MGARGPLRASDHLHPCNQVVEVAAAVGCWQVQPWVVAELTASMVDAFAACTQAGPYASACQVGTGQLAAEASRVEGKPPLGYCGAAGNRSAWVNCMTGAVQDAINHDARIGPGLDLCATVQADVAQECYGAVGIMHAALVPDAEARWEACAAVADSYREACAAARPGS